MVFHSRRKVTTRRRPKRTFRKRKVGPRRRTRTKLSRRPKLSLGMPNVIYKTLKYTAPLSMVVGTNGDSMFVAYRGNNPYDPAPEYGNFSADYYVYLSQVYRYCLCYSSKVNYQALSYSSSNPSNSSYPQVKVCLFPTLYPNNWNLYSARSAPYFRTTRAFQVLSQGKAPNLTSSFSSAKAYDIPSTKYDVDDQFSIDSAAVPFPNLPRAWYWMIGVIKTGGIADNSSNMLLLGTLTMYYHCKFYRKKLYQPVVAGDMFSYPMEGSIEGPFIPASGWTGPASTGAYAYTSNSSVVYGPTASGPNVTEVDLPTGAVPLGSTSTATGANVTWF